MYTVDYYTDPSDHQTYEPYESACLDAIKDDYVLDLDYFYANNRMWRFFCMNCFGLSSPSIWIDNTTGRLMADYLWQGIYPWKKTISKEYAQTLIRTNWDLYQKGEVLKKKTKDSL